MPTPTEILSGLNTIANDMSWLAIIWHIFLGIGAVALVAGWKPTKKIGSALIALPILSVGILAWIYGNPFNGMVFLVFGIGLVIIGLKMPGGKIDIAPLWVRFAGIFMIIFGWVYPHFVETESVLGYLILAPTGLVPCPTLSVVLGFTLIFDSFRSRLWGVSLLVLALFYGIIGVFRLKVFLDIGLLFGAMVLSIRLIGSRKAKSN